MVPYVQFERDGVVLGSGRIPLQDGMTIVVSRPVGRADLVLYGGKIGGEPQNKFPLFGGLAAGAYRVQIHPDQRWGFVHEPLPVSAGVARLR